MLDVLVAGKGKACNYYLTITNTHNNDEWSLPKTSAFPATEKYSLNLMVLIEPSQKKGRY